MRHITPLDETLWAYVHNEASENERRFVLSQLTNESVRKRLLQVQQLHRLLSLCGQISLQRTASNYAASTDATPGKRTRGIRSLQFPVLPAVSSRSKTTLRNAHHRWLGY